MKYYGESMIRFMELENINVTMHYDYTNGRGPGANVIGEWTTID